MPSDCSHATLVDQNFNIRYCRVPYIYYVWTTMTDVGPLLQGTPTPPIDTAAG